jgi:hypothetical protein
MSRENRRRAALEPPAPVRPVAAADPDAPRQRTISWRHCGIGLVVGEVLLLILLNASLILTNIWFGAAGLNNTTVDGGIVGVCSLLAVIVGGFLAARLAGRFELYQGIVVAIGFIAVGAVYQFIQEAQIVHTSLATALATAGPKTPVNLGNMDMGGLIGNDLIALIGGSAGGLLGRRRTRPSG